MRSWLFNCILLSRGQRIQSAVMLPSVASADSARQSWQPDQNRVVVRL